MLPKVKKPYVIYLAEVIYKDIADIKKNNSDISNIDAIEGFIGTKKYEEISSGNSVQPNIIFLQLFLIK